MHGKFNTWLYVWILMRKQTNEIRIFLKTVLDNLKEEKNTRKNTLFCPDWDDCGIHRVMIIVYWIREL